MNSVQLNNTKIVAGAILTGQVVEIKKIGKDSFIEILCGCGCGKIIQVKLPKYASTACYGEALTKQNELKRKSKVEAA